MIIHEVKQGSPEWHALRATTRNASEAPAMMGVSQNTKRGELLRMYATGITKDVSDWVQKFLFDKGHDTEAKARAILEEQLGEDLYPLVATDDEVYMLASSDGSDMCRTFGFEHKMWNEDIAAMVSAGEVPDSNKWQLDQQIKVFGFEKIIFVCSDGTKNNFVSCEYRTTPERIARLDAGWKQFDQDVTNYQPEVIESKPILHANPIDNLPALFIEVTGRVTASNLVEFKAAATAVISSIKTELVTDQDFVDATAAVKYLKDVEDSAKRAKQNALDQTTSIAELHRALDEVAGMAATVRKSLDKKITEEKETRKEEIVLKARNELIEHCRNLNTRIGGFMPPVTADFAGAIKGLRSLDSMNEKVGNVLREAQYQTSQTADRIEANIKSLEESERQSWRFLFPDLMAVCNKAADDFAALLAARKASHAAAESARIEKIRAEEKAKAEAAAAAKVAEEARIAKAEADAKAAADKAEADRLAAEEIRRIDAERKAAAIAEAEKLAAEEQAKSAAAPAPQSVNDAITREFAATSTSAITTGTGFMKVGIDESGSVAAAHIPTDQVFEPGKTIKLGDICGRLGFTVTADFLASLGINPVATDKNAKLYSEAKFPTICRLISEHVMALAFKKAA